MDQKEVLVKAASALRGLVKKTNKLEEDKKTYNECLKLAFVLANRGQIDNDGNSIITKTAELFEKKDDLEMIKRAMEYSSSYDFSVGYIDKEASAEHETADEEFARTLREG